MDDQEQRYLDFYIAKLRNTFIIALLSPLAILGIIFCLYAILKMEIRIFLFGAVVGFPMIVPIYLIIKRIATSDPYLTLTDEGLMFNADSEHAILILWEDIYGFQIKDLHLNKFIVVLFNQTKYLSSMSPESKKLYHANDKTEYSPFSFAIANIKRKDREKLISELDRLAGTYPSLTDQVYHPEKLYGEKQKAYDRINKKYFLGSYSYSLLFAVIALFLFFATNGGSGFFILIILQFILFPFSKLLYDVLVGFKINNLLDRQDYMIVMFLDRVLIIVYLFIYLFTIILGPLGILYFVIVSTYRFIKKKSSNHS